MLWTLSGLDNTIFLNFRGKMERRPGPGHSDASLIRDDNEMAKPELPMGLPISVTSLLASSDLALSACEVPDFGLDASRLPPSVLLQDPDGLAIFLKARPQAKQTGPC